MKQLATSGIRQYQVLYRANGCYAYVAKELSKGICNRLPYSNCLSSSIYMGHDYKHAMFGVSSELFSLLLIQTPYLFSTGMSWD